MWLLQLKRVINGADLLPSERSSALLVGWTARTLAEGKRSLVNPRSPEQFLYGRCEKDRINRPSKLGICEGKAVLVETC